MGGQEAVLDGARQRRSSRKAPWGRKQDSGTKARNEGRTRGWGGAKQAKRRGDDETAPGREGKKQERGQGRREQTGERHQKPAPATRPGR